MVSQEIASPGPQIDLALNSCPRQLSPVLLQTSYFISLNCSVLICKMGIINVVYGYKDQIG